MKRFTIDLETEGSTHVINLTTQVAAHVRDIKGDGVVHLFALGSTAAISTIEYEPGLVKHDVAAVMQKLVPDDAAYVHEATWNDDNGHSHIRSMLVGPSLTVPFTNGQLILGEYQQIIFIDFDTRPRKRKIVGTVVG